MLDHEVLVYFPLISVEQSLTNVYSRPNRWIVEVCLWDISSVFWKHHNFWQYLILWKISQTFFKHTKFTKKLKARSILASSRINVWHGRFLRVSVLIPIVSPWRKRYDGNSHNHWHLARRGWKVASLENISPFFVLNCCRTEYENQAVWLSLRDFIVAPHTVGLIAL